LVRVGSRPWSATGPPAEPGKLQNGPSFLPCVVGHHLRPNGGPRPRVFPEHFRCPDTRGANHGTVTTPASEEFLLSLGPVSGGFEVFTIPSVVRLAWPAGEPLGFPLNDRPAAARMGGPNEHRSLSQLKPTGRSPREIAQEEAWRSASRTRFAARPYAEGCEKGGGGRGLRTPPAPGKGDAADKNCGVRS